MNGRVLLLGAAGAALLLACSAQAGIIIYVKGDSPYNGPGNDWAHAYHNVQTGLNTASIGDQVWVARGLYSERITLKSTVALYGGFRGIETSLAQRGAPRPMPNKDLQETILDGGAAGCVVTGSGLSSSTILDGVTITNGKGINGGGISLTGSSPTISNCAIIGNSAHFGAGIYITGGAATVANCIVALNAPDGSVNEAGGIATVNNFGRILNNTIAYNGGQGVFIGDIYSGTLTVANNIVYDNDFGIKFVKPSYATPLLRNNNVVGYLPYDGIAAGTGDISEPPQFVSEGSLDFHLRPASLCVDAGWTSAPGLPGTDMDGQQRSVGAAVDIGADEYWPPAAVIYVNGSDGDDLNPGTDWLTAKRTIGAGINAAGWDTQVWVAAGVYAGTFALKTQVAVYGGFAGFEAGLAQRIPFPRGAPGPGETTLLGSYLSPVVRAEHATGIRLDGFTVTGGGGLNGAVYLDYSDGVIENNLVAENLGTGVELGWNAFDSVIRRNVIKGNGQGILTVGGGDIRENIIAGNGPATYGGGIFTRFSGARIINNTITGNSAGNTGGIFIYDMASEIRNNIVAFNEGDAIYSVDRTLFSNNDVYPAYPSTGEISVDPLFVDMAAGDYHISAGSPCIDAGTQTVGGGLSGADFDGDPRIIGGNVDIGADEFHAAKRIYVKADTGDDHNSGLSWRSAKQTITGGLSIALSGDSVWVARGTYSEKVLLPSGVRLYGGFLGTEGSLRDRPSFPRPEPDPNASIAQMVRYGSVVLVQPGGSPDSTRLDGFTIRGGEDDVGGGIVCVNTSPTLVSNTIESNSADDGAGIGLVGSSASITYNIIRNNTAADRGGGIYTHSGCSPEISHNTIQNNTATAAGGGGLFLEAGEPGVRENMITANHGYLGGGIACSGAGGMIEANVIDSNQATAGDGGGIYGLNSTLSIRHNTINGNTAATAGGGIRLWSCGGSIVNNVIAADVAAYGGGIHLESSGPDITNNTITGNTGTTFGGGLDCSNSPAAVSNNVVSLNWAGIGKFGTGPGPTLRNNDVFGNVLYQSWDIAAGSGDIAGDPMFKDWGSGDYHLTAGSACIDQGWNSAPGMPGYDIDGDPRILGAAVDIGADEYVPVSPPVSTVPQAKALGDESEVNVDGGIVSAAFSDFFYVQPEGRQCGIRVEKAAHGLSAGSRVRVEGTMRTSATSGERYIEASLIVVSGSGPAVPLFMINRTCGGGDWQYNPSTGAGQKGVKDGTGLNNIGLLVRTSGTVGYAAKSYFYVDDGSGLDDGSGHIGLKVMAPAGFSTQNLAGKRVIVIGACSCYKVGSDLFPLILPRDGLDIEVLM